MTTKISHLHHEKVHSTQNLLKSQLLDQKSSIEKEEVVQNILISTSNQSNGVGRHGNKWDSFKNSLAFSFTIKTDPTKNLPTLPLELSAYLAEWLNLKTGKKLKVKWPNDILTINGEKCGGILCHYINPKIIIAGIGLNYGPINFESNNLYKTKPGFISDKIELSENDKKNLPLDFYKFFLERYPSKENKLASWEKLCIHMNKSVKISHSENSFKEGIFKGIGSNGEAILELENKRQEKFMSGSLNIIS